MYVISILFVFIINVDDSGTNCNVLEKAIKASFRTITDHMDSDDVTTYLYQEGVLSADDYDILESKVARNDKDSNETTNLIFITV